MSHFHFEKDMNYKKQKMSAMVGQTHIDFLAPLERKISGSYNFISF